MDRDRLSRGLVLASLAVFVALAFAGVGAVVKEIGKPFPGFFVLASGAIAPQLVMPERAQVTKPRFAPTDRIRAVDGRPVSSGMQVMQRVRESTPGRMVEYEIERANGQKYQAELPVQTFTRHDFETLTLPMLFGALLLFVPAALGALARPRSSLALYHYGTFWGLSTAYGTLLFDSLFTYEFILPASLASALGRASLLALALVFPVVRGPMRGYPRATALALFGLIGAEAVLRMGLISAGLSPPPIFDWFIVASLIAGLILLAFNLVWTASKAEHLTERRTAIYVMVAMVPMFVASILLFLSSFGYLQLSVGPAYYEASLVGFPICFTYILLVQNLFELDAVLRKLLRRLIATAGILAVVAAIGLLLRSASDEGGVSWLIPIIAIAIPLALFPFAPSLLGPVERAVTRFFPTYKRAAETLTAASHELARLREPPDLAGFLQTSIGDALESDAVRVLVRNESGVLDQISPTEQSEEFTLATEDALNRQLEKGRVLHVQVPQRRGSALAKQRAEELGVALAVPLPPGEGSVGALLLGPRRDGRFYTSDDLTLLEALAAQAAMAILNARALEKVITLQQELAAENVALRNELHSRGGFDEIVGDSEPLRRVLAQIEQVAPTDAAVLITGETGTGKRLVVRALHQRSRRRTRPLVEVSCAAMPEHLLEAELFGDQDSASAGETEPTEGRLIAANGGTLFLDDIDNLSLDLQAKLQRMLQTGEVQEADSKAISEIEVRLVAATHRDLFSQVEAGRFREDLYYRLNIVPIQIPPLRDRKEDIPLLVEHFINHDTDRSGRRISSLASETLNSLMAHDWPGNVRELRNVIRRAVIMGQDEVLRLPGPIERSTEVAGSDDAEIGSRTLADLVREYKIRLIKRALAQTNGNQREAAQLLGMHRPNLSRTMRSLEIRTDHEFDPSKRGES